MRRHAEREQKLLTKDLSRVDWWKPISRLILTVAELTSKAGKIGGKRRMASLTPEERSELARQGGLVGGAARAKKLSAKRRSEIARQAVLARWAKKKNPD